MKKLLSLILSLAIILSCVSMINFAPIEVQAGWTIRTSLPTSSEAAWDYYSAPINNYPISPYNSGNCTWYAYGRAYEVHGFDSGLGALGHAKYWYWAAYNNSSWQVDKNPLPGAVLCWDGEYGHVGFVEAVNSNGTVTWTESNYAFEGQNYPAFRKVTANPATYYSTLEFQGYIHVGTPKGSTVTPKPITYSTISDGTYYIKNVANDRYLAVSGHTDAQDQNVNSWPDDGNLVKMGMVLSKATSGYKIRPTICSSRLINSYGDTVVSGNNVNLWDDVNDSSQWWGFEKVTGGYVIRNMMNSSCVLTVNLDDTYQNVYVNSYTGRNNQIWSIQNAVTYNANGGSGAPATQMKNYDSTLTLSSTKPTRSGYTFLGWSISSTATSATYSAGGSYTANKNVTLYAVWAKTATPAPTYTITYDANGGSGAPSSQTKTHGTALKLSSTKPTRDGYTFLGWATSSSATSATYSAGASFTGNANTTLYAVWKVNATPTPVPYTYTVTDGKATITDWDSAASGDIVIPSTLGGCPVTGIGERAFDGCSNITKISIPSSVTSIGDWAFVNCNSLTSISIPKGVTAIGYNAFNKCSSLSSITIPDTVTYIGGSAFRGCVSLKTINIPDSVTSIDAWAFYECTGLTSITFPKNIKAISAKVFYGCTNLNSVTIPASVTAIADGAFSGSGLKTVNFGGTRAQWDAITVGADNTILETVTVNCGQYKITYDANGGSGAPSAQTKTYGTALTLSSTTPTKEGYTFLGWATSSSATSANYSAGASFTTNADTTLYAVWKVNTYTITYDANGGTGAPSAQTKTHGTALTLSTTEPTRDGYTFLGWATSKTATSANYSAGASFTTNADTTLYAVWKVNTYTITYDANGGTGAPSAQTKAHGTALTLSTTEPTREGYTFIKWAESTLIPNTTHYYLPGDTCSVNANITLYAVWEANTYTITYDANGGSGAPSAQTKTHGTALTLSSTTPTKEGYTFLGWATSATATTAIYQAGESFESNADTTFYAVWEAIITPDPIPENAATVTVETLTARAGETVQLAVKLENNPGIWGLKMVVNYDKTQLTLTNVVNGEIFADSEWTKGNLDKETYTLSYSANDFADITTNGTLAILEFTVNENATADATTEVKLTYEVGDIINIDFDDIELVVVSGGVEVKDFIYGDLNSDGLINKKDELLMKMYIAELDPAIDIKAADVFYDGAINKKDELRLKQYLADWDVTLGK